MSEKIRDFQQYKRQKEMNEMKKIQQEKDNETVEDQKELEEMTLVEKILDDEDVIDQVGYEELYEAYCEISEINKEVDRKIVEKCREEYITSEDRTLKQIMWSVNIEDVLDVLEEMFDYASYELEEFRNMYNDLIKRNSESEKEEETLHLICNDYGDLIAIKGEKIERDMEMKSWNKWLNASCSQKIMNKISEEEWVARCFWSMTFHSFNEKEVETENMELFNIKQKIIDTKEKDRYTLKQLLWRVNWRDVEEVIEDFYIYNMYPDEADELRKEYKDFYKKMLSKEEIKSEKDTVRLVCKMDGTCYLYDFERMVQTELCEEYWGKTLGTKCSELSFEEMSEHEVVAHALAEMMFFTSNEEELEKYLNKDEDEEE